MSGPNFRIAVLWKRRYMGQDVILDRYARLYELPRGLAELGHDVLGLCLSYRALPPADAEHSISGDGRLRWRAFNSGTAMSALPRYWRQLGRELAVFRPDLLLSGSDALHCALTHRLARRRKVPYVLDLYDNYDSFGLTRFPGLRPLYRQALRRADGLVAVSKPLAEYLRDIAPGVPVMTLESTVDPARFYPRPQAKARARLQLPPQGKLLGVSGSLNRNRGICDLYRAFLSLAEADSRLFLVLAGDIDPREPPPGHPRVIYLGRLSHDDMPWFFCALDLALVPMIDTAFGRYAFPQKAYEIMACRTPLLTTRVGALADLMGGAPECLYPPHNPQALQEAIERQLTRPVCPELTIPSWREQVERLQSWLEINTSLPLPKTRCL